ncbi:MAG TPA: RNA-guided pseudouridylation complex pseudouridine synthase subunit Cbf5, partial [Methanolinea sp.]|nr:RNA-guided pseudouridylation complex pseudouridine synthase subunit Cbf5 [Methanolinea sp.]
VGGEAGVVVRDSAVDALCHGAALSGVGIIRSPSFGKGELVTVWTGKGELICLGEALVSSEKTAPGEHGLVIAPRTVFMAPGTYPRGWKRRS